MVMRCITEINVEVTKKDEVCEQVMSKFSKHVYRVSMSSEDEFGGR